MARRDVDEYFALVQSQYQDLLSDLAEIEKESNISEDIVDDIKKDIDVIKANRDRLAYMMYLLDKPKRKEKAKRFENHYLSRMKEKFGNNSADDVIAENEEALERIEQWKIS